MGRRTEAFRVYTTTTQGFTRGEIWAIILVAALAGAAACVLGLMLLA